MSIAHDLARNVNGELTAILCGLATGMHKERCGPTDEVITRPFPFTTAQALAMLRIEATFEAFDAIAIDDDRSGLHYMGNATRHDEPRTFLGVAFYEVRHPLPEPGWKVINPLKVRT